MRPAVRNDLFAASTENRVVEVVPDVIHRESDGGLADGFFRLGIYQRKDSERNRLGNVGEMKPRRRDDWRVRCLLVLALSHDVVARTTSIVSAMRGRVSVKPACAV